MAIAIFLLKGEIGEEWEESGISWQVRACKNYNQFSLKQAQVLVQPTTTVNTSSLFYFKIIYGMFV